MEERGRDGHRMLTELLAASHLMPVELLPAKTAECAAAAGFDEILIYLADLQHNVLRLLPGEGPPPPGVPDTLPVGGTVAGRAFQYLDLLPAAPAAEGTPAWWVPLLDGTERIGVLHLASAREDTEARADMEALAGLVSLVVVSKRDTSDTLAGLVRTGPMSVAAEMQWTLMAPRTYADGRVAVSAAMEPAYDISGDAFEYAVDGPLVHLTVLDAMGHDTAAGLCATLALGACRNARRQGAGLVATGEAVEAALVEQYDRQRYVTGILAVLDTRTGVLEWVNRGHHPPIVIRENRWVTPLPCAPAHPMGTDLGLPSTVCREQLQPGDRLVLHTDGITEARRRGGPEFGLERFVDFLLRHHADGLPVPETLRRLVNAVLDHHEGHLQDDATVLLCEWLGPHLEPVARAAAAVGVSAPGPRGGEGRPTPA